MLPLLFVTKTSLSSQTMKSSAAMREENGTNCANSSLVAKVSFEWKFGKRALRGANVFSPPYISPDATYKSMSLPKPSALSIRPTSSGVSGHLPCLRTLSGLLAYCSFPNISVFIYAKRCGADFSDATKTLHVDFSTVS